MTAIYFGFNPPFLGGSQNILSRQEDEQLIKNDLLQLLLTVPGERVNRPNFGTPLRSFVFEQNTNSDIESLRSDIIDAINRFDTRVRVIELSISQEEDQQSITIKLVVRLVRDPKVRLTIEKFIQSPVDARQ